MKKLFIVLAVVSSTAAIAQSGPSDVCRRIGLNSPSNSAQCAQVISRSRFDQPVVDVAMALANANQSSSAVLAMQAGANRRMEANTTNVCKRIVLNSASNAVACLEASLDARFNDSAIEVAMALANANQSSSSVEAMKAARDAYVLPTAAAVCKRVALNSASNAVACLVAIANKDFINNSESVCMDLANRNQSSSAVTCLNNSGIEYSPFPPMPTEVVVSGHTFSEMRQLTRRANNMLERGRTLEAQRALEDLSRLVDQIAAENGTGGRPGRDRDHGGGREGGRRF